MKKIFAIAALACLSMGAGHAAERFEPGSWLSTSIVGGRKTGTNGPRCVTAQEARSMNGTADTIRVALESDPAWKGCKIRDVKAEGTGVAFTAACAGEVVTTSQTTYAGSSYEGTIRVAVAGSPILAMTIKGERVGSCP